jgi:hypothetical protein
MKISISIVILRYVNLTNQTKPDKFIRDYFFNVIGSFLKFVC